MSSRRLCSTVHTRSPPHMRHFRFILKYNPIQDCWSTPHRGKICLPKMEQPNSEGHVMLKEDECQKSVWLIIQPIITQQFRLIIHNSALVFDNMHTGGEGNLWHRPFSQLLDLCDLYRVIQHTVAYHSTTYQILLKVEKLFVDKRTYAETLIPALLCRLGGFQLITGKQLELKNKLYISFVTTPTRRLDCAVFYVPANTV